MVTGKCQGAGTNRYTASGGGRGEKIAEGECLEPGAGWTDGNGHSGSDLGRKEGGTGTGIFDNVGNGGVRGGGKNPSCLIGGTVRKGVPHKGKSSG